MSPLADTLPSQITLALGNCASNAPSLLRVEQEGNHADFGEELETSHGLIAEQVEALVGEAERQSDGQVAYEVWQRISS
jgi:hypothetical protein